MALKLTQAMIDKRNEQAFLDISDEEIEIQDLIDYGYVWFTGAILTNAETDLYNRYTFESNMAITVDNCDNIRFARSKFLNSVLASK